MDLKKHFEMSLKVAVIDEQNTKTSNDLQSSIHCLTLSNKMDYIICIIVLASFNKNFVISNYQIFELQNLNISFSLINTSTSNCLI